MLLWKTHHAAENKKGKFRIIHTVLAYLNPNMTTKLPYHPPKSRERGLYKKINFVLKKVIYWFLITIYRTK